MAHGRPRKAKHLTKFLVHEKSGIWLYEIDSSQEEKAIPLEMPVVDRTAETPSADKAGRGPIRIESEQTPETGLDKIVKTMIFKGQSSMAVWRPTGRSITYHNGITSQIILHNYPFSEESKKPLPVPDHFTSMRIRSVEWSPLGCFCCAVYGPPVGNKTRDSFATENTENVILWKVSSNGSRAEIISKLSWRRPSEAFEIPFKWSEDDRFLLYGINRHELSVHYSHDFNLQQKPITLIKTENLKASGDGGKEFILDYSLSPYGDVTFSNAIICLVTSDEDNMVVRLLEIVASRSTYTTIYSQALPKADRARISWAPSGGTVAVLGNLETSSDQYSGQRSAYVISNVFQSEKTHLKTLEASSLHAFSWSPTRDEFIAIKGTLPTAPELMDVNCNTRFSFPAGYLNSVTWDGNGQKILLGGFGNLAGQLSIWYRDEVNKKMTSTADLRVPCTVTTEWNLQGTLALVASIYPRMKVDNHFKLYSTNGALRACVYFDQLLKVAFQPIIHLVSEPTPASASDVSCSVSTPVTPTSEVNQSTECSNSTDVPSLPDDLISVLKRRVPDLKLVDPTDPLFKVIETPSKPKNGTSNSWPPQANMKPPTVLAGEFGAIGPTNRRSRDEILQQDVFNYLDKLSADFMKQWSERPQGVNSEIIDVLYMLKDPKYREEILRLFIAQCFAPDFRKASFYWHSSILTRIIKQLMARNSAKVRARQLLYINPTREQLANNEQPNNEFNITGQEARSPTQEFKADPYKSDQYKADPEVFKNSSHPPIVAPVSGAAQPSSPYAPQYGYYPGYGSVYPSQRNPRGSVPSRPLNPTMEHKTTPPQDEDPNVSRFGPPPGMYTNTAATPGPPSALFSQNVQEEQTFHPPRLPQPNAKPSSARRGGQVVASRGAYGANSQRPRPSNTRLSAHAAEFMPSAASGK